MHPIISRTTTERIVRATLAALLINGFAIAFLWDGYVGYARKNMDQLVRSLGLDPDPWPVIDYKLTAAAGDQLARELREGTPAEKVEAQLGKPDLSHGDDLYYLGPGGHLLLHLDHASVKSVEWIDGIHPETELAWQRWIGYALAVFGIATALQFLRVVTIRVSLTVDGLKVRGAQRIPFNAITGLRADTSGKGRGVKIEYSVEGRTGSVKLDDYVVKNLSAIVAAICEQTGFPDPHNPDGARSDAARSA